MQTWKQGCNKKKLRNIFWSKFFLPCLIYLCELFFPIWPSYASSSSQSCLHMRVITPYMIQLCVLCFPIWSSSTTYSLREICLTKFLAENFLFKINNFLENRFPRKHFCRKMFMVAKSFPRKQVCKKKNWEKFLFVIFLLPCLIYLYELFFPIWPSYASSSYQSCLHMRVITPYMIQMCVLCLAIWSSSTR